QNLPAVACRHDPRRSMYAHPVVPAFVGEDGLAGVQPHADAEVGVRGPVVRGERALPVGCRRGGVAGAREDVEERVALRVDLLATVGGERLSEQPLVLAEDAAVAVAEL